MFAIQLADLLQTCAVAQCQSVGLCQLLWHLQVIDMIESKYSFNCDLIAQDDINQYNHQMADLCMLVNASMLVEPDLLVQSQECYQYRLSPAA